MYAFLAGVNVTRLPEKQSFLQVQLLFNFSSCASRGWGWGPVYRLCPPLLADEKQCALFHYTVNPISCFTLCGRVAQRGNEWDGTGRCWHKSHNPWGNTSRQGRWGKVVGFWAIKQSIQGLIRSCLAVMEPHLLLKWELCTWLDRAPETGSLFMQLPIPTKRPHRKSLPRGKRFKYTIK